MCPWKVGTSSRKATLEAIVSQLFAVKTLTSQEHLSRTIKFAAFQRNLGTIWKKVSAARYLKKKKVLKLFSMKPGRLFCSLVQDMIGTGVCGSSFLYLAVSFASESPCSSVVASQFLLSNISLVNNFCCVRVKNGHLMECKYSPKWCEHWTRIWSRENSHVKVVL